jgi:hypothetical protein
MILDEVSMLTLWIVHRVFLPLRSMSEDSASEFGGMKMLSVGDLLPPLPFVQDLSGLIVRRLIARLA